MILRNIALALLALVLSAVGFKALTGAKTEAAQRGAIEQSTPVETRRFGLTEQRAEVTGQGAVEPARAVGLSAQVSGLVTRLHPALAAGGLVREGDRLAQLDPTDYQLAVQEAQARVTIAEQEVQLEAGRREVARKEWEAMGKRRAGQVDEAARERATRVPQQRVAEANLRVAQSALQRARVALGRATLKAPFNALVLSESLEVGQLVGLGAPVAQLAGTDAYWVKVAVPSAELEWLTVPAAEGERGSRAMVRYDIGARVVEREGYVVRLLGQLESTGRMAQVVVEVPEPTRGAERGEALLLGAQVEVLLEGRPLDAAIELPRAALRGEGAVWVFGEDGKVAPPAPERPLGAPAARRGRLVVKPVTVLRRRADSVLVRAGEGLSPSDEVVVSRVATPVQGMLLRSVP